MSSAIFSVSPEAGTGTSSALTSCSERPSVLDDGVLNVSEPPG